MEPLTSVKEVAIDCAADPHEPKIPPGVISMILLWSLAVALLSSMMTYRVVMGQVYEELALRPPVAVIDPRAYVEAASGEGASRMRDGMKSAEYVSAKLSEQGYLVLERNAVFDAPESLEVKPRNQ